MDSKPGNYPIGLFDSGVGGFSVLREIRNKLPHENTIYFADTGRRRYGTKSEEEVLQYASEIIRFLILKKAKAIVIACNTVSAVFFERAKNKFTIPIMGVIKPGVRMAINCSKKKRIGLIGTEITIRSKVHQKIIESLCPTVKYFPFPTPILGEFVEQSLSQPEKIQSSVNDYLSYFKGKRIDTLILGCTHYPFLISYISQYLGDQICLVDPAEATVIDLKQLLNKHNLLNKSKRIPEYTFFTSGDLSRLNTNIEKLLELNIFSAKVHSF